ncbi:MAG: hypothetical protein KKE73_06195 [Proteobacteria bacterium]|nr:hypothetical protein [Pseudomonadota bacterium]
MLDVRLTELLKEVETLINDEGHSFVAVATGDDGIVWDSEERAYQSFADVELAHRGCDGVVAVMSNHVVCW